MIARTGLVAVEMGGKLTNLRFFFGDTVSKILERIICL